jgi:hypothetical protein
VIKEIKSLRDVTTFMEQLVSEGVNVHPDTDFCDYVHLETGAETYTANEAAIRNRLMRQSSEVCARSGVDVYDFMQEVFLKATGLDKYIPLPSNININRIGS